MEWEGGGQSVVVHVSVTDGRIVEENEGIETTSIPAENDRLVNTIYLNKWQSDDLSISENDLNNLLAIASQCPQDGGDGVYRARALYAQYFPDEVFRDFDCESVEFRRNQNSIEELGIDFILKPNPANNVVQIDFKNNSDFSGSIRIVNALGEHIAEIEKPYKSNLLSLELYEIPSGVYFVQLWKGDSLVKSQKLSVIK